MDPRLLLAAMLLAPAAYADPPEEARAIARARKLYAQINAGAKKLRTVKKTLEGFSLEGGEMTAWFAGDRVRKIEAHHYGEMWRGSEELYFDPAERLCFILEKVERYGETFGPVVSDETSRYYFLDGKLVATRPDKARDPDEVADHTPRLLESAEQLRAGAHLPDEAVTHR